MGNITKLHKKVIDKIAAGEVVARPVDIVKELIENAIDAKASDIQIRVKDAGLTEITVIDNGIGMPCDDLCICYQNHSTSKLSSVSDLDKLTTLGFRGEALYSIALAADLEIKSKPTAQLEGYIVVLNHGELNSCTAVGMPTGTVVTVTNLFNSIPARRKFISDTTSELKAIKELVLGLACFHYGIRFRFYHNGNIVYDLPYVVNWLARFSDMYGQDFEKEYLGLTTREAHFSLDGYISLPVYSRSTIPRSYLYVNGRLVTSLVISNAIKSAYVDLLESRKIPDYILHLSVPLDYIDVNVHPKKETVRFLNDKSIFDFVYMSVKRTLQSRDLTFIKEGFADSTNYMQTYISDIRKDYKNSSMHKDTNLLQVHGLYLIAETPTGLLLIDQHAAHERIVYEKLLDLYNAKNKESIELQQPVEISLSLAYRDILVDNSATFIDLGFKFEFISETACVFSHIPSLFINRNIKSILLDMLDDVIKLDGRLLIDSRGTLALSYLACRTAIKAGEVLDKAAAISLIAALENTNTSYTCPHGRPAKVEIPLREIEKLFKR